MISFFQRTQEIKKYLVIIDGNKATGILYCLTTLISEDHVKTTFGIHYNDEYIFKNGKWLIAKRSSHFDWTEVVAIGEEIIPFIWTITFIIRSCLK